MKGVRRKKEAKKRKRKKRRQTRLGGRKEYYIKLLLKVNYTVKAQIPGRKITYLNN